MEAKSRVEKYRKHREEIAQMDTYRFENPYSIPEEDYDENDVAMNEETLKTEHIKKSTLSISIDQLIKAHDEYTVMISQEEIKRKKKEAQKVKFRKIRKYVFIFGGLALLLVFFIVIILVLLNR